MTQQVGQNKFTENALKYGFSLFGLPKTGQTISFRTGDDGDLEKGYPRSGTRYTDNGDGTITDNATGLMWVKQPENIGGIWESGGQPVKKTWNEAVDDCLALDYAGHNDWRLPNIIELLSLLDISRASPSANLTFFPNTKGDDYWSSSTLSYNTSFKFKVWFNTATMGTSSFASLLYIRPVRLGVPS